MRVPSRSQSNFRYPLSRILSSEGAVRVLRELIRHGGEVAIPRLAEATKLNQQTVRNVLLGDLTRTGIAETVGQGRSTLYRARTTHPLHPVLDQLFAVEEVRVQRAFQTLAEAARAAASDVLAVWIFGSVARGDDEPSSDLDVALVVSDAISTETAVSTYPERASSMLDSQPITPSSVAVSSRDVQRLAATETTRSQNRAPAAHPLLRR